MGTAYIRYLQQPGTPMELVEIINLDTGATPPPRPHPEPPLGIWGPTDPRPGHPISGIPGLPGYEPPKPGEPPKVMQVSLAAPPAGVTPPAAPPADAAVMLMSAGPGTKPAWAWVAPYASQGPVEQPA